MRAPVAPAGSWYRTSAGDPEAAGPASSPSRPHVNADVVRGESVGTSYFATTHMSAARSEKKPCAMSSGRHRAEGVSEALSSGTVRAQPSAGTATTSTSRRARLAVMECAAYPDLRAG